MKFMYLLIAFSLLNLYSRCSEEKSVLYPKDPIRFSQDYILAIKTEQPYQAYRDTLENIDLEKLQSALDTPDKKLAFWINTYNAMVQAKVRDDVEAFKDIDLFFKQEDQRIGGINVSLDQVENGILRKKLLASNVAFIDQFQVDSLEPRIHFTLNCGATSCPPIAYYSPENLDEQLRLAEQSFVGGTSTYDLASNTLSVSELFNWFEEDFGGRSGVLNLMKRLEIIPSDADPLIVYSKYDWNLDLENY